MLTWIDASNQYEKVLGLVCKGKGKTAGGYIWRYKGG